MKSRPDLKIVVSNTPPPVPPEPLPEIGRAHV